jgi:putative ABC transport system permease protein
MFWRRKKTQERDLERELRSDLELEAEEQRENGLPDEEAHYAARRAFGNATLVSEDARATWGWSWMESCLQDLRFGTRILARSPGVSLAIVVSLALGLGATAALFSLLNSLLFKALPVAEPDRLVIVRHGSGSDFDPSFPYLQFKLAREQSGSTIDLFAYSSGDAHLRIGETERKVPVEFVSGDFFRVLGIQPFLGRLLAPSDDAPGSPTSTSAVISYRLWKSEFHSDPSVVGRRINVDSIPFTIAGVAPNNFYGVEIGSYADLTLPLAGEVALNPSFDLRNNGYFWLLIMGRLKPGVAASTAQADLNVVWKNLRPATVWDAMPERYKTEYFAESISLAPGANGLSELRDRFTRPLYVLLAMTGVILLISCSNIANLLLARSLGRQREFALRLSIGARRGRLIRQLLTESGLLALAGLVASVGVYQFCVQGLLRFLQTDHQQVYLDTTLDLRMTAFVGTSVLLALAIFGLAPAVRATRQRLSGALAESSQAVAARSSLSRLNLSVQIALSFSLLLAAILLSRSLYDLRTFNAGLRRDHLLLITPEADRHLTNDADRVRQTQTLLSGIRNLPGVQSASASIVIPMEGSSWQRDFTVAGYLAKNEQDYHCYENLVMPDFFRTVGTRLLSGRDFADRDSAKAPQVAVVNESFARRYWGNDNPLGRQFREVERQEPITVIGVVEDAKYRDLRRATPPTAYFSLLQMPAITGWSLKLEVWTQLEPHLLIGPVRDLLNRELSDTPVTFQTFAELVDEKLLYERMLTALSVAFGSLGILICAVGVYGVAAYSVSRRTSEIGVRLALGATPGAVIGMILREQMILVVVGLAAGTAGALLLTRFLRTWLFGVSSTDSLSLISGMLWLAAITALATYIPARRAAGVQPLAALRHE